MADIKFKIIEHCGVLSVSKSGWTKELNLISWNEGKPKLDIQDWDRDHVKMGKGVTLTREEAERLKGMLEKAM